MMIKSKDFMEKNIKIRRFLKNDSLPKLEITFLEKERYHFDNWEMFSAFYENDIIWDGLNYNREKG